VKKATTKRARRTASKRTSGRKTAQVRARIDPAIKEQAEDILEELGLNPSTAISTFYSQIVLRRGLPFLLEVPNEATAAAIGEARHGSHLIVSDDMKGLLSKLLSKQARTIDLVELLESTPDLLGSAARKP
jgi:DNA-damage-inducible protein J